MFSKMNFIKISNFFTRIVKFMKKRRIHQNLKILKILRIFHLNRKLNTQMFKIQMKLIFKNTSICQVWWQEWHVSIKKSKILNLLKINSCRKPHMLLKTRLNTKRNLREFKNNNQRCSKNVKLAPTVSLLWIRVLSLGIKNAQTQE